MSLERNLHDAWSPSNGEDSKMEQNIEAGDIKPHDHVEINLNLPPKILAQQQED